MNVFDSDGFVPQEVGINDIAKGPTEGIGQAIQSVYNDGLLTAGNYAVEAALREQEQQQISLARKYGSNLTPLALQDTSGGSHTWWNSNPYWKAANPSPDGQNVTNENDAELARLKEQYPDTGFKSYAEMLSQVQSNAQNAYYDQKTVTRGWAGSVLGNVIGGLGTQFNLRYNNPASLVGWGAAGAVAGAVTPEVGLAGGLGSLVAGAAGRAAINAATGAAINAVGNLTGANQERQVLGLPQQSLGEEALSGAEEGALGSLGFDALHGAARPLAGAVRNWLHGGPEDIHLPIENDPINAQAVAEHPHGPSPDAAERVQEDIASHDAQLNDMQGPDVGDQTALAQNPDTATPEARADSLAGGDTEDTLAFKVDPAAVGEYNYLAQAKDSIRAEISSLMDSSESGRFPDEDIQAARVAYAENAAQIKQLQAQLQNSGRNSRNVQERINDLVNANESLAATGGALTSAERTAIRDARVTYLRDTLMQADERQRDLAPLITRAYSTARDLRARNPAPSRAPAPEVVAEQTAREMDTQAEQGVRVAHGEAPQAPAQEAMRPSAESEQSVPEDTPLPDLSEAQNQTEPAGYRLPSQRTIAPDEPVTIIDDDGNARLGTAEELMQQVREAQALDDASRICGI